MAQKNTLQYILLGLLSHQDMTGYDIKKLFETELSDFWYANHSQIYPELRRLESEGYITSTDLPIGEKRLKHEYHLTVSGSLLLANWMHTNLSDVPPSKDEFPIKAYLISTSRDSQLRRLLQEEILRHETKYAYLLSRKESLFPDKSSETNHYGHALILRRALHREKAYLAWLIEELEALTHQ